MAEETPTRSPGGAAVLDKAPERVRKRSPRYKVLLHNDPVNSMEYVMTTLRQVVPQLSEQAVSYTHLTLPTILLV